MSGRFRVHPDLTPLLDSIDHVKPHPRNVNMGDTDAIIESIQVNGFTAPILVQRSTGYIVAGNHRYAAVIELGGDEIPVIWLDMDDEQALRYMLADNRSTRLGKDDLGLLQEVLEELQGSEIGLTGALYDDEYLENLRNSLEEGLEFDDEEYAKQNSGHICQCPRCGWTSKDR